MSDTLNQQNTNNNNNTTANNPTTASNTTIDNNSTTNNNNNTNDQNNNNNNTENAELLDKKPAYIFVSMPVDLIAHLLILIVLVGSYYIYNEMPLFQIEVLNSLPDTKFPAYKELLPSFYYLFIIIIVHKIFIKAISPHTLKRLDDKYLNDEDPEIAIIYKNKVASNIFKFFFYLISTIFGYYVLKDSDILPSTLLGSGSMRDHTQRGFPDFINFNKPEYLTFYYNINLSYALFDMYILFSQPLQSDFLMMVLHHLSTISLVVFSYVGNLSSFGAIIFFLFYMGDVYSYIVRVLIYIKCPDLPKAISTLMFLANFAYTRIYVFGDILYYLYLYGGNTIIITNLVVFLWFLMILNVIWLTLISKKFVLYCFTNNIEEIYKIKKKNK